MAFPMKTGLSLFASKLLTAFFPLAFASFAFLLASFEAFSTSALACSSAEIASRSRRSAWVSVLMDWEVKSEGTVWTDSESTSTREEVLMDSVFSISGGGGARFCGGISYANGRELVARCFEGSSITKKTQSLWLWSGAFGYNRIRGGREGTCTYLLG